MASIIDENIPDNPPADNGDDAGNQPANNDSFNWSSFAGENGDLAENWKDALPEDLRSEKCFDNIHTLPAFFKSYANAQKMIGGNKVLIPGENGTKEDWDAFYRAGGRPEKMEDYAHDEIELPEGIQLDDATLGEFRKFAFDHGLSQKAFEAAVKFDIERVTAAEKAAAEAYDAEYHATEAALKKEYGDQYGAAIGQYVKALETFGVKDLLIEKGLINNLAIAKAFINIGGKVSESKLKEGDLPAVRTLEDQLADAQADPAFRDKYAPGHDAAVKKVSAILAKMGKQK